MFIYYSVRDLSWNSSVGIVTSEELDDPGFESWQRPEISFFKKNHPHHLWRPFSLLLRYYRCYILGLKRPRTGVDRSPPSSAEVKNKWSHTSTPPRTIWLHITNRGDFTLTIYRMIFEILMAVSIQITVFLGIMPCSLVDAYQIFLSTQ
jgi:hypothetical protein